jgi:serine/threonine-protein kinase
VGPVTREYERIEQEPVPAVPPERVRAWHDELGWALVALLVLVVAGLAIWWFAFHERESKRAVPAVAGTPVAAAVNTLQDHGFKVRIVNRPHGERPGIVFRIDPSAGTQLAKGSTVQVLASSGPATVPVPNAVGLSEADGRDRLVGAGFEVTESRVFSDGKVGTIVAQSPAAGSKLGKGATVRLNVSKGSATVIVPNVVGNSVGEAETTLAKAGLKSSVQLHVPSAQPVGTVVAQDPPGGQAKRDSTVRLNVSTGSARSSASGTTGATGATGAAGTG